MTEANLPQIRVTINFGGYKPPVQIRTRKTKRLWHFMHKHCSGGCHAHLVVKYGNGFSNEGVYFTLETFKHALNAFLHYDLIIEDKNAE